MTVESQSTNIASIQVLRGIAAFMVVVLHLLLQTERLGFPEVEAPTLASGVDIFFVISGFIMWVTTARRPGKTAGSFYRDRIARIVPLYWCITAFVALVLLVAPHLPQTVVFSPEHVVASFLFLPAVNPANGSYTPLLIPGWTLNYEMFFYLLFGGAMALGKGNMWLRAGSLVLALVLLVTAGRLLSATGIAAFYTHDIMLEFAFGIGLGGLYLSGRLRRSRWWWLLALAGGLLLAFTSFDASRELRAVSWGLPATLIVAGCLFAPPLHLPLLEKLGDWSYSLYLSHPILLSASGMGWREFGGPLPMWLFVPFALAACVAAAALLYRFVELPSRDWVKSKLTPKPRSDAKPAPGALG